MCGARLWLLMELRPVITHEMGILGKRGHAFTEILSEFYTEQKSIFEYVLIFLRLKLLCIFLRICVFGGVIITVV